MAEAAQDFVELFARLVAYDSTSSKSNKPIADFVADYLQQAGCTIQTHAYDNGTKLNVIARRGSTGEEAAVAMLRERLGLEPFDLMDDAVKAAVEAAR